MDLTFIRPLYDHPGPFASVYIDTERVDPQDWHAIDLRWRRLRARLGNRGADAATLDALAAAVGLDRGMSAPEGRALFAAGGRVLLEEELWAPPSADDAVIGGLPYVLPLLARRQEYPPFVFAAVDRVGADLEVRSPSGVARREQVTGATSPIRKVRPGEWSQPRFQRRAENTWDRNARGVAAEVERLAVRHGAALITVVGDVRARSLLLEHLGKAWRERAVEVFGGRADEPGPDRAHVGALAAAAALEQAARQEIRERFAQGLAEGAAVEGLAPSVAALREGNVDALILAPTPRVLRASVWWGPQPGQLAMDARDLEELHVAEPRRDRAADALVRAVVQTDGDLLVVSGSEPAPPSGVGAILRHRRR
jgi:hypothetical protein